MQNINIELSPFDATALIAFFRANENRINIEQLEDASAEMRSDTFGAKYFKNLN